MKEETDALSRIQSAILLRKGVKELVVAISEFEILQAYAKQIEGAFDRKFTAFLDAPTGVNLLAMNTLWLNLRPDILNLIDNIKKMNLAP